MTGPSSEASVFRRAVVLGASVSVLGAIPPKLTGALSVQIADDLGFSAALLGSTISVLHIAGAVAGVPLGRLADWLGSTLSIRIAAGTAAVAFIGVAALSVSWPTLIAMLVLAEIAGKLGSPAASRLLIRKVPTSRLGTAFGLKQSSGPVAGMIAGISVPVVAVTVGWRWAYALVGIYAIVLVVLARRSGPRRPRVREEKKADKVRLPHRSLLAILAVAFGLQGSATTLLVVFYVPSAVEAGVASGTAGLLLALSSAGAMLVRILAGRWCDRMASGHLRIAAALLAIGTLGVVLLAVGQPITMMIGIALALCAAWGQPGVFWFSAVSFYSETPGRVTGLLAPANNIGSIIGPFVFGMLVAALGYSAAWVFCAAIAISAAAAMLAGNQRIAALNSSTP